MLRSIRTTACTALVVAAAVPGSAALASQDLRMPDTRDAALAVESEQVFTSRDLRSPDARDAALATESGAVFSSRDLRSPDARDAARGITPGSVSQVPVVQTGPSGFDWGDAGIGAAGGLAILALLGGTAVLMTQRRRHRVHPRAH